MYDINFLIHYVLKMLANLSIAELIRNLYSIIDKISIFRPTTVILHAYQQVSDYVLQIEIGKLTLD